MPDLLDEKRPRRAQSGSLEGSLAHIPGLSEYLAMKQYLQNQGVREQNIEQQNQFDQEREGLGDQPSLEDLSSLGMRHIRDPKGMAVIAQGAMDRQAAIEQRGKAVEQMYDFKIKAMEANVDNVLRRITAADRDKEAERMLRKELAAEKAKLEREKLDLLRELGIAKADAKATSGNQKTDPAYTAGLREITKDDANADSVRQIEEALKRWRELQPNVSTGRVTGTVNPGILQPQYQELQRLENFLAVNNFKPGQGQISNFERQLIKGAGPAVRNDPETNMRITQVMLGAAQNAKDRLSFRQWYLEKNKKLLGADKEWNDYIEKFPRFVSGPQEGSIVTNENRPDWLSYFTAKDRTQGGLSPEKEQRYQELLRKRGP